MLRLFVLTTVFSVTSGARSWTTIIVDPAGAIPTFDSGRDPQLLQEGDPHLTRTTYRPTCAPTITPGPTSYPSEPVPSNQPSGALSGTPSTIPSNVPSSSLAPTTSAVPSLSPKPTATLTPSGSLEPSYSPESMPSSVPSRTIDHINGNGGCAKSEVLYEVILRDQFGDGWDGLYLRIERLGDNLTSEVVETQHLNGSQYVEARIVYFSNGASNSTFIKFNNSSYPIKSQVIRVEETPGDMLSTNPIFQDTLAIGDVGIRYACLQPGRCYEASILEGGSWADEISWEIRRSTFSKSAETNHTYKPIVNGGAPSNCTFAVPGDRGALPKMFCPSDCHLTGQDPLYTTGPSAIPVTPVPTTGPSATPVTPVPTSAPVTAAPVVKEELMKSDVVLIDLNAPSLSLTPSKTRSLVPTLYPSVSPSQLPSHAQTSRPSVLPSIVPTIMASTSTPSKSPLSITSPTTSPSLPPTSPNTATRPPHSSVHDAEREEDDEPTDHAASTGGDGETSPPKTSVYNGGLDRDSL